MRTSVVVSLVVALDGSVSQVSGQGGHPAVRQCATDAIQTMRPPRPTGQIAHANVNLSFRWR